VGDAVDAGALMAMPTSWSRTVLVCVIVALPAIAGAVTLGMLEGRLLFASHVSEAPVGSLGEALRRRDLENAFLFIRAGQDPNQPIRFRDPILTGDREIMISPLLIAVASNNDDGLMMLMSVGARFDAPGNQFAGCLAARLGHEGIAEMITDYGGPAASPNACPDAASDPSAPLTAFGSAVP